MLSTNFMTTKFPQASRASGSCLSSGPTGNSLAIGVGPVLISQTAMLFMWHHCNDVTDLFMGNIRRVSMFGAHAAVVVILGICDKINKINTEPVACSQPLWLLFQHIEAETNGRHFADDIFKCIFLNENVRIQIKISLKFVPKGPINNILTMVQIMAWRVPGDKPLSEPMMVSLPTHICIARPQWVNRSV